MVVYVLYCHIHFEYTYMVAAFQYIMTVTLSRNMTLSKYIIKYIDWNVLCAINN